MIRAEHRPTVDSTTGLPALLTSFIGRADDAAQLARLLEDSRLVTVTGPGGTGKTRLVIELARRVGDTFPDGAWFVELTAAAEAAHVPAEVMSVLGVQQDPGRSPLDVLAEVLAPRRLLLILDNCEHVLAAVAELCTTLLARADEVHILVTSRERLGLAEEAQYRLSPLELPGSDEPAAVRQSAAAVLFAERASQADSRFTLSEEHSPLVARIVARLDGMPLAIELAAARVEALGLAGLADRIDDVFRLLTSSDRLAAARHRSLAAVADWSYQLLSREEQRVFRRLAVFRGPFTLAAAEAVAGPEAGPVLRRLVDCSLLVPPRTGPDQRTRYPMLQTLRAYALTRLREADEEEDAMAALAAYAECAVGKAAVVLDASDGEPVALHWLDAEDATLSLALSWSLEHDPEAALRLATEMVLWLRLRGRVVEATVNLSAAVARAAPAGETWARAQLYLGFLMSDSADETLGLDYNTAAIEAYRNREPSRTLVEALAGGRAIIRLNMGDVPGATDDARRALTLAHELGDPASELYALTALGVVACYTDDAATALNRARQAQELLASAIPGNTARWCHYVLALVLYEIGQLDSARRVCATGLTLSRLVNDLMGLIQLLGVMADIERQEGDLAAAGAHMREALALAAQTGHSMRLLNLIESCGHLSAAGGHWADAITLWAAFSADGKRRGRPGGPVNDRYAEYASQIEKALDPAQLRAAEDRGAAMPVAAAAELAVMAATAAQEESQESAPGKLLTPREWELVSMVAQGRTNTEIAARLFISVRTVSSHLDRIRDKTGCRRRADLTRLALSEGLV